MVKKKAGCFLVLSFAIGLLVALAAAGCGSNTVQAEEISGDLTLSGSTTVLPIAQEAADMFMDKNPNANVTVQGGGSSVGITNVLEGIVDIGDSSRELKDDEKGKGLMDYEIAYDVITVITNKDVPVDNLSAEQVKGIFTGKIHRLCLARLCGQLGKDIEVQRGGRNHRYRPGQELSPRALPAYVHQGRSDRPC